MTINMKSLNEKGSNVKVVCRFRPLIEIEIAHGNSDNTIFSFPSDEHVHVIDGESFTFDKVFSPASSQKEIFESVGVPIIEDVLTGYNGTVIAYGQTGSGKSYSMLGNSIYDGTFKGIIPRAVGLVFDSVEKFVTNTEFTLKCSMLEIYKEKLKDLLGDSSDLKIKEDRFRGIYVQGLNEFYVSSEEETFSLIILGERNRTVASTKMNSASSRSHQLFMFEVKQKLQNGTEKRGLLNLVDLAGSEKINQTGVTGNNLEEAKKINLSLSALSNVIKALTSHNEHIPYRDSKLTRLLQESLGGNYKTTLIICCSPHPRNLEDTLNTLKFAQRAKTIKNKARLNIQKSVEAYIKIIEELKLQLSQANSEIEKLKTIPNITKPMDRDTKRCLTFMPSQLSEELVIFNHQYPEQKSISVNDLEMDEGTEISRLKEEITALKQENTDLETQVSELKGCLTKETNKRITDEKRFFEYCVEQFANNQKEKIRLTDSEVLREENKSLKVQVSILKSHVEKLNAKFTMLLKKLRKGEKISEWEFNETKLNMDNLASYTQDTVLPIEENELESLIEFDFDPESLIKQDCYAQEMCIALEESSKINQDVVIFQLKKQVISSGLINCELIRNYYEHQWREKLVKEKYNLKVKLLSVQEKKIASLESILDRMQKSYSKLIELIERSNSVVSNSFVIEEVRKGNIVKPIKGKIAKQGTLTRKHSRYSNKNPSNAGFSPVSRKGSVHDLSENSVKFRAIKSGFQLQCLYNEQLRQDLNTIKNERNSYKALYLDLQLQHLEVYNREKKRWENYVEQLKDACNHELVRKQNEINKLNEQVGEWMEMYQQLRANDGKKIYHCVTERRMRTSVSTQRKSDMIVDVKNSPFHVKSKSKKLSMIGSIFGDKSPALLEE